MMAGRELKANGLPPMENSFTRRGRRGAVLLQQFGELFQLQHGHEVS